MELIDLLRTVRRWLWLILIIVVVTELALWFGMRSAEPAYAATVRLQISAPQREEVAAYDQYRFNPRDEITVAINNLVELLQSEDVYQQTTSQLGLDGADALYTLDAGRASDADFLNVTVEARSPELAAAIANTHVGIAIAYYGELRAQSTLAEKDLFAGQLQVAEEELRAAEKALADFRIQNGIYSLESQMSTQQRLIEQLQLERDQRLLEQATTVVDPVGEIDVLIAQRMKELDQYATLAPQYFMLTQNVEQAREVYQDLLSKYNQAELTATEVQAATFIQVIKPAYATGVPESSWPKLAVLALVGSLGLGVMLALLLQYFSNFRVASETVPVDNHKMQLRGRRKAATISQVSKAPESDHITPSLGHTSREIWKRISKVFRRRAPLYEHANLDVEPDAIVMEDQNGSTETKQ
ncbi:MAG: Wzz/FepE/Etk N-terminal domain-containing protein [Chloroflexota bacterium]